MAKTGAATGGLTLLEPGTVLEVKKSGMVGIAQSFFP
jgi:hypothetical protein